ncbi:MAG: CNNM domain-containing protein [Betaproteobacteria bacterium]
MDTIPSGVLAASLVLTLLLVAFFSIAETSMMAVNRYKLATQASAGQRGAQRAQRLLAETDKLLGVILLGATISTTGSATLAALLSQRMLGDEGWVVGAATLMVSFALLIFSEISPKVVGANYADRIAPRIAYLLVPMLKLAYPIVWFVNLFVSAMLKALRLQTQPGEQKMTQEEVRALVLEGSRYLPPKHHTMLVNLLDLEKITVDDIMTPRREIDALDVDAPLEEIRSKLETGYHTRVPVCRGQPDNIIGVLLVRQVLHRWADEDWSATDLQPLLRAPYYIPTGTPLLAQLQHFQESRQRLGLVVDEYGELLGLITLEDILEEIVGEFTTNAPGGDQFARAADGSVVVEGSTLLRTLNRRLGTQFPSDGPRTLNGLILEHFGDIPEAGVSFRVGGHGLEILHTQDRAVKTVRVLPIRRSTRAG